MLLRLMSRIASAIQRSGKTAQEIGVLAGDKPGSTQTDKDISAIRNRRVDDIHHDRLLVIAEALGMSDDELCQPTRKVAA